MSEEIVTVFGGTGFLGRRVVQALIDRGKQVRVAARRPEAVGFSAAQGQVLPVKVDIRDDEAVAEAVSGARAVVNAVSLYKEKGELSFESVHVQGAERVARCVRSAGVQRLVHVSGIGVDKNSPSRFVRARARGEEVVRGVFAQTTIVRPSVMFACDEGFLQALENVTRFPVVPLFGRGDTRLQPAFVDDVARAIASLSQKQVPAGERSGDEDYRGCVLELGGSKRYTYRQAVQAVAAQLDRKRWLVPVAFPLWQMVTAGLNILPKPPLTRDQVLLMESDNVVGSAALTFTDLGIQARSLEDLLAECYPRE